MQFKIIKMNPAGETFVLHNTTNKKIAYSKLEDYKKIDDDYTYFITFNK